jgi:hypothetical protein
LCILITGMPFWRIRRLAVDSNAINQRGAPDTAVADMQAGVFQLFHHSFATMIARTETRLFFNVRHCNQIRPLPVAGKTAAERSQAARADIHDITRPSNGKCSLVIFFILTSRVRAFPRINDGHAFTCSQRTTLIFWGCPACLNQYVALVRYRSRRPARY